MLTCRKWRLSRPSLLTRDGRLSKKHVTQRRCRLSWFCMRSTGTRSQVPAVGSRWLRMRMYLDLESFSPESRGLELSTCRQTFHRSSRRRTTTERMRFPRNRSKANDEAQRPELMLVQAWIDRKRGVEGKSGSVRVDVGGFCN